MVKWIKLPALDCFVQDPNICYIIPCKKGTQIVFKGEVCTIEDVAVMEIVDKFNAIGCTSFQLTKEEIEKMIEELKKED